MKSTLKIVTLFTLAISVISCHIYKPYKRPQIETSGLYRDLPVVENDSVSIANISRNELFTDPYLQNLLDEALSNNPDLRSATLTIEQSEAQYQRSKAAFSPSLSLGVTGNITGGNHQTVKTWNTMLNSSWEIDIFGKLLNAKRAAKALLLQSEAYKCAVQTRLISSVSTYYYTLLMLDEQLSITEQTLQNWIENVATMELLLQAGMVNQAAVAQSKANRYGIEATIPDLKSQICEAENALSILLNRTPGPIERSKMQTQQFTQVMSTGVPSLLLSNRPDVRQAEYELMLAYANTNISRSMLYPSIVLSANSGYSNSILGAVVNPAGLMSSVAGSLTQPLFNRLALTTQLKVTKKEQEKALIAFETTLLKAESEVSNALFLYQILDQTIEARQKQIEALEKSVAYTQELLLLGSSTYIEVLTAQQALLAAQISNADDTFRKIQSIITLYAALGGGAE